MDSLYAIKKSIKNYASGGNVLIVATLLAFIIANSPIADMYFSWWAQPISLQLGDFNLFSHNGHPMTVMEFINDALMAIFFFSIGLEIKREVLVGELTSIKQALLPIVAAIGGMVIPVLLFMYIGGCLFVVFILISPFLSMDKYICITFYFLLFIPALNIIICPTCLLLSVLAYNRAADLL